MFNIQVSQKDLAKALSYVESTVGNNSQNLGDDCVSITDLGTNKIEIYTTNSIEFSRVEVVLSNGSSKKEKMPFVNFKRFKTMIDSIPDSEYVSIKSNVNDIEINYGTRKKPLKLTGSTNGIVNLPTSFMNTITINRRIIEKGLNKACSIIKDDTVNPLSNCIRIKTDAFNVEITAIDAKNNRMMLYKDVTTDSNNGNVVIEANKFKKAFSMFDSFVDVEFETNTNNTVIKVSGSDMSQNSSSMITSAEYYTRTISGIYPGTVASSFDNVSEFAIVNKDELKASLMRINAIEDNTIGSGTMDLKIDKDLVSIIKTSQYGIVEDSFNIENTINNPIFDTFKAKPLAEILKNFADNASYGSPNTFCIGKTTGNMNAYVLKEDSTNNTAMFLILPYGSSQSNP